jgi:hypothetical protein
MSTTRKCKRRTHNTLLNINQNENICQMRSAIKVVRLMASIWMVHRQPKPLKA